ncbi:hypothetical protein PVAND_012665 [Polypedilum vanderplanki]|uniref:Uncharacterized protein n=1 Tax=Polypedilum vanderplanki TaxID=319348 RepID=A0A9J6CN80_POLVA|nr:hypothetical protein PVAND_012665 [Polypedilum vanderplanki]
MEIVPIEKLLEGAKKGVDVSLIKLDEDEILKPINYLREKPYDAWVMWSKIINFWLKVPEDKMKIIDQVFEYFCDATFMIDDIIDQGLVRRGQEPPYLKYGYPSTVACLEYVHYKMIEQANDAFWIKSSKKFTFDEYMDYGGAKSTTFFALNVRLMQLFATEKVDLEDFLNLFGIFFFIANDHENLFRSEEAAGELLYADDLTEGKYTFATVYAIDILKDQEVYEILMSKPEDIETRRRCIAKLKSNGAHEYSVKTLHRFCDEIKKEADKIGHNPFVQDILDFYMDFDLLK